MIESRLERKIVNWLVAQGCIVHKLSSSNQPGFPDRIVVHNKFTYYMELKTPVGRLSKVQKVIHKHIQKHGIEVYVVRSLEEAKTCYYAESCIRP